MTVSAETNKVTFSGNGSTTVFASSFKIFDDDDILVEIVDSDGTVTTQTKTTHYSVSTITSPSSAVNITMVTAPATGETLVLRRNQPQLQSTDYVENDNFPAQTHENALDKLAMMVQEHEEKLNRTFLRNPSYSASLTIPILEASKVLAVNSGGTAFELTTTGTIASADVVHTATSGYVANEHIDWTSTSSNFSTSGTAATGNLTVTGTIAVTSTVDGRDIATDGTKLDGIEASADVTDATNVNAAGATMNTDTDVSSNSWVLDEDTLSSDSDTKVPTQQSVKAYVDASVVPALTQEEVEDFAGAMVATGGTKTGITVTYQDATGDMDFVTEVSLAGSETLTNKTINTASNTITVVEADISDLGSYITASSSDTLTNKTFDANGSGNSLSNVDVADLATGTDGEIITWDASGNPTTVAVGTSGHVLTSNGAGAAPTFQEGGGGGLTAATQAQQEAGTSEVVGVTPAVQHYHTSAAKMWVTFTGTGTVTIDGSYNVTSITDVGTGNYTVNIATDMSSGDYAVLVTSGLSGSRSYSDIAANAATTAGTFKAITTNASGTLVDADIVCAAAFGDQ